MSLAPYPKYKPSGVDWLGDVPTGWEVARLKNGADIRSSNVDKKTNEDEIPVSLCNYVDVYYHDKITASINFMKATATQAEINKFTLYADDVVITKDSESANDIGIPSLLAENIEGLVCGYHLAILRRKLNVMHGPFLFYVIDSDLSAAQFEVKANGVTRFGLSLDAVKSLSIPIPPLDEQEAIAGFLDLRTGAIDALITKKQDLLRLLAEKRTALITHAVTKGLNPNTPLKKSGINWLGDVPVGWEVKALRYIGRPIIGLTYSPNDLVYEGEGSLVLRASNIQKGKISLHDNVYVSTTVPDKLKIRSGDILVCTRNGSRRLIGKNALINNPESHWTFGAFNTVIRSEFSHFLYWVLNSSLFEYQSSRFLTSTINQLTISTLKSLNVPFPPLPEQKAIADYLDTKTKEIDAVQAKTKQLIKHLKEYRTALITNAVTGKIKVV